MQCVEIYQKFTCNFQTFVQIMQCMSKVCEVPITVHCQGLLGRLKSSFSKIFLKTGGPKYF